MAALNKENCEEHPRSNLAENSNVARSQEDYITQFSEENEGKVTKRLSKEFSRTENWILGALARLDAFLMNLLLQGHSGTTLEPSRNALSTTQGTNEDDSQNDPNPEAGHLQSQITQKSGPEDGHDTPYQNAGFWSKVCCFGVCVFNFFYLSGGGLILFFLEYSYQRNQPMPFGISTRRPVHNHTLVNTADLPGSTWFETRRRYAGTLPPLTSRLSINL